jgi:bifunctional DNA-binding transcriptional regulator/antitoxin component of YhaV-PrlF toxin-antitoxin module
MKPLRVGSDGSVTLPAELRKMTGIEAGTRLVAVPCGNTVILTPVEPLSAVRGLARGADTTGYRDRDDDPRR